MVLDLNLRVRIWALENIVLEREIFGLLETAPGVRSLQIRYDNRILPLTQLIETIIDIDSGIEDLSQILIDSRILHLPMCFDSRCVCFFSISYLIL